METQTLKDLLSAEKKAAQVRENAVREAEFTIEKANKDADSLLQREELSAKEEAKALIESASKEAQKEAQSQRKKSQDKVAKVRESTQKNRQKAVSLILEKLDSKIL